MQALFMEAAVQCASLLLYCSQLHALVQHLPNHQYTANPQTQVVGEGRCPIIDTWWQTETGAAMIAPMPFAWRGKPGSATVSLILGGSVLGVVWCT